MITLAALALFGFLHRAPPVVRTLPTRTVRTYQERHGDWRVKVEQDAFAQRATCRLFVGRLESDAVAAFEDGRVVFKFNPDTETREAVYRIDGGPPLSAAPELRTRPVRFIARANLESSTGGFVFVPAAAVASARTIDIRADDKTRVRRFRVAGLDAALASAQARGCAIEPVS